MPPKTTKKRKLTPRETKFFKILSENPTLSISEAGRKAGYAENTVKTTLYQKHVKTSPSFQAALEKAGLTEEAIAKKMQEGTNAFATRVFQERKKNGYQYHKENMVDFKTRKDYLELWGRFNHKFIDKIEAKVAGIICNIDKKEYLAIREELLKNDDC